MEDRVIRGAPRLSRYVVTRAAADWPLALAAWLLLIGAATLLVAGTLYADTVALGGLRHALLDADPEGRTVGVRTLAPRDSLSSSDSDVITAIQVALGPSAEVARIVHAGSLAPTAAAAPDDGATYLVSLAAYGGIERHASLDAGAWPRPGQPVLEAAIPTTVATTLGLRAGDLLVLAGGGASPIELRITGTWQPIAGDPYWRGGQLETDGTLTSGATTVLGPVVAVEADLLAATIGDVDVEWRGIPNPDTITIEGITALHDQLTILPGRIRDQLPVDRQAQVDVGLAGVLEAAERSTIVSRGSIVLLTLQFAVLAVYAIILVAGVLLDSRRASDALLRSRGIGTGAIVSTAVVEAAVLSCSAAIAAVPIAVGVVWAIARVGPLAEAGIGADVALSGRALLVAAASALIAIGALTVPTISSTAFLAGIRGAVARQTGTGLPQRLGIDIVLVVLGAVALWQLRLYGTPVAGRQDGSGGVDPLLVAAPALGLIAGSLLTVRVVPRLAALVERLLTRWGLRGIVATLGGREVARRPFTHLRAVLLIVLMAALGTFAAAQGATWRHSQLDQAAYQSVADIRVVDSPFGKLPAWSIGSVYRSAAGVRSARPAAMLSASAGHAVREATLLALDAGAVSGARAAEESAIDGSPALAALAAEREPSRAVVLPGTPRRLAVVFDASLRLGATPETATTPTGWQGLSVALVISDADGQLYRLDAGFARPEGSSQRLDVALPDAVGGRPLAPASPLALEAIEIQVVVPYAMVLTGHLGITGVLVSEHADGTSPTALPLPGSLPGWTWTRLDAHATAPYEPPAGFPSRVEFGAGMTAPRVGGGTTQPVTFRTGPAPTSAVIPTIASDVFLAASGARIGDVVALSTSRGNVRVRVIASTASFPPLDPTEPFVVVDRQTLAQAQFADSGAIVDATEWWLETDPGVGADLATELRRPAYEAATVVARDELVHELTTDPIPLGVIGALGLGTVAAVLFAVIGFLVVATGSARERLAEFAIMRGLGLSARQLSAWLSFESVFLAGVGLLAGTALGVLLAWVALPVTTFTASGAPTVPPPVVIVPWDAVALLGLAGLAATTVAVVAVMHVARSAPVSDVIRGLER